MSCELQSLKASSIHFQEIQLDRWPIFGTLIVEYAKTTRADFIGPSSIGLPE